MEGVVREEGGWRGCKEGGRVEGVVRKEGGGGCKEGGWRGL